MTWRISLVAGIFLLAGGMLLGLLAPKREFLVSFGDFMLRDIPADLLRVPEAPAGAGTASVLHEAENRREDLPPQPKLANPPKLIKAIYATNWSAGSERMLSRLEKLLRETELNALVVDIKDYSGYVGYNTDLALPKEYRAVELRIPKLNAFVKRLHDQGVYLIGRISVFQDGRLAQVRPDLALESTSTKQTWKDRKGLAWMDMTSREVWAYNAAIAKEILARGFDEANFDYIRFPSDGDLDDIVYPHWDAEEPRTAVMERFFSYLRSELAGVPISADLFGLVTADTGDLGIGQNLETALPHFDAISPMVYPSHYFPGVLGYQNPALYPYEVVKYAIENAIRRIKAYNQQRTLNNAQPTPESQQPTPSGSQSVALRPWLQDFDLGATYGTDKVKRQIQAVYDASCPASPSEAAAASPRAGPCSEIIGGWMLWDPTNEYTREALAPGEAQSANRELSAP